MMAAVRLTRRTAVAACCAACWVAPAAAGQQRMPLRLGLTPVFLDNQVAFLHDWRAYLGVKLRRPLEFVQRGSYREVVGLLRQGQLDLAWLCGYPYVRNEAALQLLAMPLYLGQPLYQSYLVVPATDRHTTTLLDLRGTVFAYSDPDSNSGHLFPLYSLLKVREAPAGFFARTFFTWGHRKVVEAVSVGLARGGAVDGYVWDTLALRHPALTARTRIVERSPPFGFPPFVARGSLPRAEVDAVRQVLVGMSNDAEGSRLLDQLNLDGFVPGRADLFDRVRAMAKLVDGT
ncbi:MAG TPA: PhnD/SsuA/transferrin family substrate-binding protein [Ramlibacter sp.]